jgi:hypothetical protein
LRVFALENVIAELAGKQLDPSMVGPLLSGLQQGSIKNPSTPQIRQPLNGHLMLDAKRISRACEMVFEPDREPVDPITGHIIHAMGKTADALSKGMDGPQALMLLQDAVQAAPPQAAGTPGLPPVQPGPAVGAPVMGGPPQGATPSPPAPDTGAPGA